MLPSWATCLWIYSKSKSFFLYFDDFKSVEQFHWSAEDSGRASAVGVGDYVFTSLPSRTLVVKILQVAPIRKCIRNLITAYFKFFWFKSKNSKWWLEKTHKSSARTQLLLVEVIIFNHWTKTCETCPLFQQGNAQWHDKCCNILSSKIFVSY